MPPKQILREAALGITMAMSAAIESVSFDAPKAQGRSYEKSKLAFRTIGEIAVELDVAQHVLRFWESKFSQIRPLKHRGGRRYYRPEDVDLLRRIRALLYDDGYSIKGAQRLLKEGRARRVALETEAPAPSSADARPKADIALPRPTAKLDGSHRQEMQSILSDLEIALDHLRHSLRGAH